MTMIETNDVEPIDMRACSVMTRRGKSNGQQILLRARTDKDDELLPGGHGRQGDRVQSDDAHARGTHEQGVDVSHMVLAVRSVEDGRGDEGRKGEDEQVDAVKVEVRSCGV